MYLGKRVMSSMRIPIVQLSIEGEFIKEWASSLEASKALSFDASSIIKCCKGKQLTCKDYKWKYKSEYID